jgi:hypothetical protein
MFQLSGHLSDQVQQADRVSIPDTSYTSRVKEIHQARQVILMLIQVYDPAVLGLRQRVKSGGRGSF